MLAVESFYAKIALIHTVSSGDYAGHALCYDCTQQLVAENVQELTRNKNKIKAQFILSLIGIGLGFILGMSEGISSGDIGAGFVAGLKHRHGAPLQTLCGLS